MPSPSSPPVWRPTASRIEAIDSPPLWTVADRPGIYHVAAGAFPGSFEAIGTLRDGSQRVIHLARCTEAERQFSAALGLVTVTESEMFVCDRCGRPTRSAVVTQDEAVGACCSTGDSMNVTVAPESEAG